MPEFVSMVVFRDYVLAITRDGELWKIWHSEMSGEVAFQKLGKLIP